MANSSIFLFLPLQISMPIFNSYTTFFSLVPIILLHYQYLVTYSDIFMAVSYQF